MKKAVVFTIVMMICVAISVFAQAPQKINYQGKLLNSSGNPVNGSVSMTFNIYDVATDGTALWTETQTVTVTDGIYNVLLGQNNPIDTELTETKPLWLGVKVGTDAEMTPRVVLTPGVYDLIILNKISVKDGKIGIGTTMPYHDLSIQDTRPSLLLTDNDGDAGVLEWNEVNKQLRIQYWNGYGAAWKKNFMIFDLSGNASIGGVYPNGNYKLLIDGAMKVNGADLAEPFDMTDIANLELGDVVVIDPKNPNHVKKSIAAYDTSVAGIVSSTKQAGYVAGSRSDGSSDKPVALVGRVLCKVSNENGQIQIGDLLTTASLPGHAMKATDRDKAFGSVLGKALQAFDGETGMIMVLVALQ